MFSGDRLTNIRIGVTDIDPMEQTPTMDNMNVCACQNRPIAKGSTERFPCWAHGRYLVILLEGNLALSLCEVEVFEGKKFAAN